VCIYSLIYHSQKKCSFHDLLLVRCDQEIHRHLCAITLKFKSRSLRFVCIRKHLENPSCAKLDTLRLTQIRVTRGERVIIFEIQEFSAIVKCRPSDIQKFTANALANFCFSEEST
jgi:hypothetical protein